MERRRHGEHGGFARWTFLMMALLALSLLSSKIAQANQVAPGPAPVAAPATSRR